LREQLARLWIKVVAQGHELFPGHVLALMQSQLPDAFTNPLTTLNLALGIIIVVGQVLVKILLGHSDVLLRYAAKHTAGNLP
jgi:hypothetical protein